MRMFPIQSVTPAPSRFLSDLPAISLATVIVSSIIEAIPRRATMQMPTAVARQELESWLVHTRASEFESMGVARSHTQSITRLLLGQRVDHALTSMPTQLMPMFHFPTEYEASPRFKRDPGVEAVTDLHFLGQAEGSIIAGLQGNRPPDMAETISDSDWMFSHYDELVKAHFLEWVAISGCLVIASGDDPVQVGQRARQRLGSGRRYLLTRINPEDWERPFLG